ncbi:MAG: hypothetical protein DRH93_09860 [Deltaproteobacteria bacterium]|nr:MAG: hypothetical protein DRH93_09860 [Deltaproteobacteria bacterium]
MNDNNLYQDLMEEFKDDLDFKVEYKILELTENICKIMEEKKMNRAGLATIMETSKAAITKMLNGSTNFTLKRLLKVAIALDKDLDIGFKETKRTVSFDVKTETIPALTKSESSSWTTFSVAWADLPKDGKEKPKIAKAA